METKKFTPENRESKEIVTSKIDLRFFRHGEKEPSVAGKPDEEMQLTERGREQAIKKSEDEDISQSLAFGSPRKRAQQTVGFAMAGQLDKITGKESLEELKQKLNKELKEGGSRIAIDKRLDFNEGSTEFRRKMVESYKEGVLLKFLLEQSDMLAESLKDKDADTYGRMAGKIAEIVEKYLTIAPRWNELVQDESKKYKDTLKRFLCTHQGVAESFLMKIIEKTKGKAERDVLAAALNNQGFDYTEGFDVEIENNIEGKQEVRIIFKKEKDGKVAFEYDEIVPIEIIENLIPVKSKEK